MALMSNPDLSFVWSAGVTDGEKSDFGHYFWQLIKVSFGANSSHSAPKLVKVLNRKES